MSVYFKGDPVVLQWLGTSFNHFYCGCDKRKPNHIIEIIIDFTFADLQSLFLYLRTQTGISVKKNLAGVKNENESPPTAFEE